MNIEYFQSDRYFIAEVSFEAMKRTILEKESFPPLCKVYDYDSIAQLIELPPHAFIITFRPFIGSFRVIEFKMCLKSDGNYFACSGLSEASFFSHVCLGHTIIEGTPIQLVKAAINRFWGTYFSPTSSIKMSSPFDGFWRKLKPISESEIQQKRCLNEY